MMTPEELQHAKDLLKSSGVAFILQSIEDRYTEVWKGSSHTDKEIREDAYRMIRALSDLRVEIASIAKGDEIKAYNSRLATNIKMR